MGGRRRVRSALVAALVLVAACSGDDDGALGRSPDETAASTEPASSETVADDAPVPAAEDVLRLGVAGVESIDPVGASPAAVADVLLADLFYDTLTVLDGNGGARPGLADFTPRPEGNGWRFVIRQGTTFADGSAVTADDVVYSLDRVRSRGTGSLAALRLESVESVTALDERTVDVVTDIPSAVVPELLSSPLYAVTDRQTIEPYLDGGDQTPNASGDFAVTIESPRRFVLERRRGSGPGTVIVQLYETETAALDAFLAGEIDWTVAPIDRLGEAVAVSGPAGVVPFHGGLLLGVDPETPPLNDPRLRRAVALAVDRTALVDAVLGPGAQPMRGIVPAGVPGAPEECLDPCGPDVAEAQRIVDEVYPDGNVPGLRLLVDDSPVQRSVAGVLGDQLGAVGLEVEVTSLDEGTYEELVAAGQQQLFLFGSLGVARTPATHLPPLFSSASPDNLTGFVDPFVDAALAAALAQPDGAARRTEWAGIEVAVVQRAVVVPLAQFRTTGVVRPGVAGLRLRADGSIDLSEVTIGDAPEG